MSLIAKLVNEKTIGTAFLGLFVGAVLGIGLLRSGGSLKAGLAVVGAALGGAPIAFMKDSEYWWAYAIGLPVGLVIGACIGYWFGSDRPFTQEGEVKVTNTGRVDVYYPVPFGSVPSLRFWRGKHNMLVDEQRADGFRLMVTSVNTSGELVNWEATGTRRKNHIGQGSAA